MTPPRPQKFCATHGWQAKPTAYYTVGDLRSAQVNDARFELRGTRLTHYCVGDLAKQLLGARIHA